MDRKEAIEILKAYDGYFIGHSSDDVNEALELAINSLKVDEQYQLEYEDCISREATKQAIRDFFPNLDDRCEINSVINMQPSVTPKNDTTTKKDLEVEAEDCIDRNYFLETCKKYCDVNCDYLPNQRQFMCKACMMGDAIEFAEDAPTVYPKSDASYCKLEDCISRADAIRVASGYCHPSNIAKELAKLPSVTPQEPIFDKIQKMKSEIADSLEFWDYSPNNNPLARDILETVNTYCAKMVEEQGETE